MQSKIFFKLFGFAVTVSKFPELFCYAATVFFCRNQFCINILWKGTSFSELATVLPRRSHLLHDLVTQVFFRCFQYGIVVMGLIDAFMPFINTVKAVRFLETLVKEESAS